MSDLKRIKSKFDRIDYRKWWGDKFDVRFYLISKIKKIKNKSILDMGGGIGIICSEMDSSNLILNLDLSFHDLKLCKNHFPHIHNICGSMTNLPFNKNSFDVIICANLLEIKKLTDLKNKKDFKKEEISRYPTVEKSLNEIVLIMKNDSNLFLTTPNNARYRSTKLDYNELKNALNVYFKKFTIFFYNTYPQLSNRNRKLNLANIIPKLASKIYTEDRLHQLLLKKDEGYEKNSVSFYVEASK